MECRGRVNGGGEGTEPPPPPEQMRRKELAAAPTYPQRGTVADTHSVGTLSRHTAGTDGASSEHGALACHEYGLLAPPGAAVNLSYMGDQYSGNGHESTGETYDQDQRET